MIKKLLVALMAFVVSACVFTSCDKEEEDHTVSWSEVVKKNPWMSIFPEISGRMLEVSASSNGMTTVGVTLTGWKQSKLDEYINKVAALSGFTKEMESTCTGKDAQGNIVAVTGIYTDSGTGEETVLLNFVNYGMQEN